ncbi:OsmC family protein [Rhodococcus sp. NPDC003322]
MREHHYGLEVAWTGNLGSGTSSPTKYSRDHHVAADGKPPVLASSDPAFRGDPRRWNPEELLVASISECHMLWFLGLAAADGIVVTEYTDRPTGTMVEEAGGAGQFTSVTLRPEVVVARSSGNAGDVIAAVADLHRRSHETCFIARSVNFPVRHDPTTRIED